MSLYDLFDNNIFNLVMISIIIFFTFISLNINIMIVLIHSRQPFLRQGFFITVFIQIILETIINLSVLIMLLIYIFNIKINFDIGNWFLIFPVIFNFCYMTNIIYNIRIIYFLMTLNKDRDELINYDIRDTIENRSRESSLKSQKTVPISEHSFKSIHIYPFLFSIVHTFLYIVNIIHQDKEVEVNDWYDYFLNGKNGIWRYAFFLFNYIYFFISIPYLCCSINKSKITNHILLKRFSIYCIFSSIVSLLFPIGLLINDIHKDYDNIKILIHILCLGFLIYLFITCFFRANCYYIQNILEKRGKSFINKFIYGFRILFCCQKIPEPNFVDLNSTFIYHSLANINDFLEEMPDEEPIDNIL